MFRRGSGPDDDGAAGWVNVGATPLSMTSAEQSASGRAPASGRRTAASRLLDPAAWHVVVEAESARCHRYGRVSTLVLVEIVGVRSRSADARSAASSIVAAALDRESRTSDFVAGLADERFGVLLTETGEIAAINFVERMRDPVDDQLQSVVPGARVGVGWAEISSSRDGRRALDHAFGRLLGDVGADADRTLDGRTDEPPDREGPATSTDDAGPLLDLAQFREHIEAPRGGGRHDPYWELEGQAVRRRRKARRAIRATVRVLGAVILAMLLARLAQVDASAVLVGPHRPLVFVASAADAVACCLVFAHQARRPRGFVALTRPATR
jgi:hypothetical protein